MMKVREQWKFSYSAPKDGRRGCLPRSVDDSPREPSNRIKLRQQLECKQTDK